MGALRDFHGNPSSSNSCGREAMALCQWARESIAQVLDCSPDRVLFTSGATESNNLALKSGRDIGRAMGRDHIVTTSIEHSSVLECARMMAADRSRPCRLTVVPVGPSGIVDPRAVAAAITRRTAIVSVMQANNELGTIQPIEECARIAQAAGAMFHTDAAQSFGKVPIDLANVDMITVSGHKIYGPKGVGALYIRPEIAAKMKPEIAGGSHEHGLRAGTLNAPSLYGLGIAAREMVIQWPEEAPQVGSMRDDLWRLIQDGLGRDGVRWNGTDDMSRRLPGNLNFTIIGVCPRLFQPAIDPYVTLSGAAACRGPGVSHVLAAIGAPADDGASVRIGLGRFNTPGEIPMIADRIIAVALELRGQACSID